MPELLKLLLFLKNIKKIIFFFCPIYKNENANPKKKLY